MNEILGFMKEDFFKDNKLDIRKQYEKLSRGQKCLCKQMLYANPFLKEHQKDLIWEYLNRYITYKNMIEAITR